MAPKATVHVTLPFRHKMIRPQGILTMLKYSIVFFIIAVVAGALGYSGIEVGAIALARILFFIFMILAILSLIGSRFSKE